MTKTFESTWENCLNVIKDNVSKLGVVVSLESNEFNDNLNHFGKQSR